MKVQYAPYIADIKGQLARNIVFSEWKRRKYARSYVKPYNPKTCKQRAHRELMKLLVEEWKANKKGNTTAEENWNKEGSPYYISGFNTFLSIGLKSKVDIESPGVGEVKVTWENLPYDYSKFRFQVKDENTGEIRQTITPDAPSGSYQWGGEGSGHKLRVYVYYLAGDLTALDSTTFVKNKKKDLVNCTTAYIECTVQ